MSTIFDPLEAGELALIRSKGPHVTRRYFVPVEPAVILTATVAATPPYPETGQPVGEFSISGASGTLGDVRLGMDVWVGTGAGGRDVASLRIRKAPTSSVLYINEQGSGDPGAISHRTHRRIEAGQHVTVVATYSLSYAFPRIVLDTDTIYKDFDFAYAGQTSGPEPVANLGPFAVGFVDETGYFQFTRSSQNSFAVAPGASITGRTWSAPGGTFVGCTGTDETVTLKYPAGRYWLECEVQDGNGKSTTGRLYVAALARTGAHAPLPILDRPRGDTTERGRRITLRVEAGLDRVPHGAMAAYFEENEIEGTPCAFTRNLVVGWCIRERSAFAPDLASNEIELAGAGELLGEVPAVPQRLEAKATPTRWHEAIPELVNVPGTIWYLLKFHCPPLMDLFDVYLFPGESWSSTAQKGFKLEGSSVGDQAANLARLVPALFASASDGALVLVRDPTHLVDRGALSVRFTIEAEDWQAVSGDRAHRNRLGAVYGTGLVYSGGEVYPVRAVAPDLVPGWGVGQDTIDGMVINSADDLRWAVGMAYAAANNPLPEVSITLIGNRDVVEPAAGTFIELAVAPELMAGGAPQASYWRRFFGLTEAPAEAQTIRLLPRSVAVEHPGGYKVVTISASAETYGSPGVLLPVEQPGPPYEALPMARGVIVPRPRPLVPFQAGGSGPSTSPGILPTDDDVVYVGSYRCRNFVSGEPPSWALCGDPGTLWPGDPLNVAFRVVAEDTGSGYQWTIQRTETLNGIIYWSTVQILGVGFVTDADAKLWFDQTNKDRSGLVYDYKPLYGGGDYDSYNWTEKAGYWVSTAIAAPACDFAGGVGASGDHWSQGVLFAAVHVANCEIGIYRASGNYGREVGDWSLVTTYSDTTQAPVLWMAHRKTDGSPNSDGSHQYMFYNALLYRTRDGWGSRTDVTPSLNGHSWTVLQLWIDWYDADRLFARLRRLVSYPTYESGAAVSSDGGATWSWVVEPGSANEVLAVGGFPYSDQALVVSRQAGIEYSTDRGETWVDRTGNYPTPGGSKVQIVWDPEVEGG